MPLGIIVYGVSVTPRIKFCGLGKIKLLKTSFLPKNSSFLQKFPLSAPNMLKLSYLKKRHEFQILPPNILL